MLKLPAACGGESSICREKDVYIRLLTPGQAPGNALANKFKKANTESVVKEIKRQTRKKYSAEEKIRIVLEGLRGEDSINSICRKEGINPNLYYKWSKDFLEAGKKRL
jgi:hypothetical protein